jgi:O-antigen/teichoic acid export membrane protein
LTSSAPTLSLARERASEFGSYSLPVTVSIIGTKIQVFGYYPIMALFLTPREVGIFTLGYLLTTFIRWPLLAVNQLLPPIASDLYAREKRQALYKLHQVTSRLIITVALLVAVFAVAYRGPILGIFGETYVQYAWILPVLAVTRLVEVGVGSVGLLLTMTDNERLIAIQNTLGAVFAVAVATGLTAAFGLAGMVVAFATVRIVNNVTQLLMLHYFEGFQPFTRTHLNPVFAVTITALLIAVMRSVLDGPSAIVAGLLFGVAGYALCLRWLGTAPAESRLYAQLAPRAENDA